MTLITRVFLQYYLGLVVWKSGDLNAHIQSKSWAGHWSPNAISHHQCQCCLFNSYGLRAAPFERFSSKYQHVTYLFNHFVHKETNSLFSLSIGKRVIRNLAVGHGEVTALLFSVFLICLIFFPHKAFSTLALVTLRGTAFSIHLVSSVILNLRYA